MNGVVDGVLSEITEGLWLGEDVVDVLLGSVGVSDSLKLVEGVM